MTSGVGFTYLGLALLRIMLVVMPQRGYIHPDEYFQSVEIIIGDIFETGRSRVWEFDGNLPIRNIVIPYFLYGIPYALLKWIFTITNFRGTIPPNYLLIFPRIVICLLSFLVDYSLISICQKCGTNVKRRLLLLASSYVMLVYGSRTFSNTIEMILFSLLLRTVVLHVTDANEEYPRRDELNASLRTADSPREKVLILRQLRRLTHRDYSGSSQVALLTVIGIFNRPTFVAYAVGPVFFWLYRGVPLKKLSCYSLHLRSLYLLSVAAPVALVFVFFDTIYYKHQNLFRLLYQNGVKACLHDVENCLVITPLNFLNYNLNSKNLATHGLHPRYLHLVNVILLYNVLGISFLQLAISIVVRLFQKRKFCAPNFDILNGFMFVSIVVPLIILSLMPHQEARFLIPLTLPVIYLCGLSTLNVSINERGSLSVSWKRISLVLWLVVNSVFVVFFGFMHQGGILPVLNHLATVRNGVHSDVRIHLFSSHTYSIPRSFLTNFVRSSPKWKSNRGSSVIVYPASSSNFELQMRRVLSARTFIKESSAHDDLIYFLFPSGFTKNFLHDKTLKSSNLRYSLERCFSLHLSTEALSQIGLSELAKLDLASSIGLNLVRLKFSQFSQKRDSKQKYFSGEDDVTIHDFYNNTKCYF